MSAIFIRLFAAGLGRQTRLPALQKDFVRAKKVAGRALALCPALPAAVRVLVYIELHEGNNARALQLLQKRHDSPAKPRAR